MPNPIITRRLIVPAKKAGNGLLNNLRMYMKFDDLATPPWVDSTSHAWTSTSNGGMTSSSTARLGPRSTTYNGGGGSILNMPAIDADAAWTPSHDGNSGIGSGTDFTLQCWVRATGASLGFAGIFTNLNSSATTGGWWLSMDSGGSKARWGIRNSAAVTFADTTTSLIDNVWHLIIAGFDHTLFTHGGMWLSIDGGAKQTFDPSGTNTMGALHGAACAFGNYTSNDVGYTGLIDEAAYWIPRTHSAADIAALWNGGAGLPLSSFTT